MSSNTLVSGCAYPKRGGAMLKDKPQKVYISEAWDWSLNIGVCSIRMLVWKTDQVTSDHRVSPRVHHLNVGMPKQNANEQIYKSWLNSAS